MLRLLLLSAVLSSVQAAVTFQWAFTSNSANPLVQCSQASFQVLRDTVNGTITPPFYLYAVPTGGVPSVSVLGSGYQGTWQVPYRATLEIVDSAGNEGGWVSESVASGNSDSCLKSTTSTVQLGLNSTSVAACGTLGIQMGGTGVAPFNLLVLPAAGSCCQLLAGLTSAGTYTATQNFSLGGSNTYLNFVANISAGNSILVAGRDSQGNWAPTSPIVSISRGSYGDGSCDLVSTAALSAPAGVSASLSSSGSSPTGGSSGGSSSSSGAGSSGGSSSNTGVIVGGVVGGIVAALILLALIFFFLRRRRSQNAASPSNTTFLRPTMDADDDIEYSAVPMAQHANVTPFDVAANSSGQLRPSTELLRGGTSTGLPSSASSDSPSPGNRLPSSTDGTSQQGTDGHPSGVLPAGAFALANPDRDGQHIPRYGGKIAEAGPSQDSTAPVVQHTDGGRLRSPAEDVPPAYGAFVDRQRSMREARS